MFVSGFICPCWKVISAEGKKSYLHKGAALPGIE